MRHRLALGPLMGRKLTRTVIYIEHLSNYGSSYLLSQTEGLPNAYVCTHRVSRLDLNGVDVDVLGPTTERSRQLDRRLRGLTRRLTDIDLGNSPIATIRLCRRLMRANLLYAFFLWSAVRALPAIRLLNRRVPMVVFMGGSDITTLGSRDAHYRDLAYEVGERASVLLFGSDFLRGRALELGFPEAKCRRHYIGVKVPEVSKSRLAGEPQMREPVRFLVASRLHPVKGVHFTIGAFEDAFGDDDNVRLIIAGDGQDWEGLRERIDRSPRRNQIYMLGELSRENLYDQMRRSDVFVQHNVRLEDGTEEGLGGSILEAAAHGLPVLATRSGGVPEAVIDGETGFLCNPGNIQEMAMWMRSLAVDPELRRKLGGAGRSSILKQHHSQRQNEMLGALLKGVST